MPLHEQVMTLHRLVERRDRLREVDVLTTFEQPARPPVGERLDRAEVSIRHGDARLVVLDGPDGHGEVLGQLALREARVSPGFCDSRTDRGSLVGHHEDRYTRRKLRLPCAFPSAYDGTCPAAWPGRAHPTCRRCLSRSKSNPSRATRDSASWVSSTLRRRLFSGT